MNDVACSPIKFTATDNLLLDGLWLGPRDPKRVIIYLHGLTGNMLTDINYVQALADGTTAVITFSNRGSEIVSRFKRIDSSKDSGLANDILGSAYEVFADCAHDIQGAVNYAFSHATPEEIVLVGRSTGCQKIVYYMTHQPEPTQIARLILIAPMTDYAAAPKHFGQEAVDNAIEVTTRMIEQGQSNELVEKDVWPYLISAQRLHGFITPDSEDNRCFNYSLKDKRDCYWNQVKTPTLVIFAGDDEHADMPMDQIAQWFTDNSTNESLSTEIISGATHNFAGKEDEVVSTIKGFLT